MPSVLAACLSGGHQWERYATTLFVGAASSIGEDETGLVRCVEQDCAIKIGCHYPDKNARICRCGVSTETWDAKKSWATEYTRGTTPPASTDNKDWMRCTTHCQGWPAPLETAPEERARHSCSTTNFHSKSSLHTGSFQTQKSDKRAYMFLSIMYISLSFFLLFISPFLIFSIIIYANFWINIWNF
jgi:hypothetical protein